MKLFKNLIISGYVEGLDRKFQIPTCTLIDSPLEEMTRKIIRKKKHIPSPS